MKNKRSTRQKIFINKNFFSWKVSFCSKILLIRKIYLLYNGLKLRHCHKSFVFFIEIFFANIEKNLSCFKRIFFFLNWIQICSKEEVFEVETTTFLKKIIHDLWVFWEKVQKPLKKILSFWQKISNPLTKNCKFWLRSDWINKDKI